MTSKTELERLSTSSCVSAKAHLLRTLSFPPDAIHASFLERFLKCGRTIAIAERATKHGPFFISAAACPNGRCERCCSKSRPSPPGPPRCRGLSAALGKPRPLSWINWELLRRGDPPPGRVNRLAQLLQYSTKLFELKGLLRSVRDGRVEPKVPLLPLVLCLVLGVVTRIGSYLDLAQQTKDRRRWRHLCGLKAPVQHEIFGYATERMDPEDWRQNQARVAKQLKRNKRWKAPRLRACSS